MRECRNQKTLQKCNCSWEPCSRKRICCECVEYHWSHKELPACFFPDAVEKTYDRSLRNFVQTWREK